MSLVRNERLKLAATALNTLGVAIVVSAIVVPTIGLTYGTVRVIEHWYLTGFAWFAAGVALHLLAQGFLGRLRG